MKYLIGAVSFTHNLLKTLMLELSYVSYMLMPFIVLYFLIVGQLGMSAFCVGLTYYFWMINSHTN